MVKHFCDRCGKEIDYTFLRNYINHFSSKPYYQIIKDGRISDKIDICCDCYKELFSWINGGKNK